MDDSERADVDRIFDNEAHRRLARVEAILARGVPEPGSAERDELWRHLHSLKGTAGTLGHRRIEEISEDMARRLAPRGADAQEPVQPDSARVVLTEARELAAAVDALRQP